MISAKLGHFLDKPLAPIAKKITISPNLLTITGFIITILSALSIPFNLMAGGILILLGGFFDIFDGVVARINGKNTRFGAFLDSTLDRYSDAFVFLAIAWYFFENDNISGAVLTIGGLVGALIISYARAKAEAIGLQCNVGLAERPERIALLSAGCITGWLFYAIVILFFLCHITAIQRILYIYKIASHNKG
ncbi:MAG: CDP-alcohol phosphatidyltransferase family protein [Thermodesulfovibrionales bacterium]|nr:CDP-alcohol phosphatidyltransferase family protein [Thermodesulfovibrionales bacterium]